VNKHVAARLGLGAARTVRSSYCSPEAVVWKVMERSRRVVECSVGGQTRSARQSVLEPHPGDASATQPPDQAGGIPSARPSPGHRHRTGPPAR
jgi:hypothetical protein